MNLMKRVTKLLGAAKDIVKITKEPDYWETLYSNCNSKIA